MSRPLKSTLAFVLTLAICALVAWVGGYDFDARNVDVAAGVSFSLMAAIFVVAMANVY